MWFTEVCLITIASLRRENVHPKSVTLLFTYFIFHWCQKKKKKKKTRVQFSHITTTPYTHYRLHDTNIMFKSLFITALVSLITFASAHNTLLNPWGKSCFFEDMKKGDELAVSFQVGNRDPSSADQLEADFWINDPNGNRIYTLSRVKNGDARVDITNPGKYEYCFSNEFTGVATKDVTFHIHGVVYIDTEEVAPDSLDHEVRTLGKLVQDIKNEQAYIVIRERVHRNTAESTNARVKWWSLFQLLMVAGNSTFQIYYLKRFFEVKSTV